MSKKFKPWYKFENRTEESVELTIFDEIGRDIWGDGIGAADFKKDLDALGKIPEINLLINSPGGDVFDGLAIYNMLKGHSATINTHVVGLAASISSVIALAGDTVSAPPTSMWMIHDVSGGVIGNADDMRKMAEALDKAKDIILPAYERTGLTKDKLSEMMSAETWMTGQEAFELGFVDVLVDEPRMAANFALLNRYKHVPEELIAPPQIEGAIPLDTVRDRLNRNAAVAQYWSHRGLNHGKSED